MSRELLQQALEALETCISIKHGGTLGPEQLFNTPAISNARKAIRAELAKPITCYRCGKTSPPDCIHTCTPIYLQTNPKNKDDLP